jgi:protein-histidine pros-kinase
VLVAEDNPVNQSVMVRMLENLGHEPTVAADGQEVLQKVESREYDVILMDIQMPNLDGFEATSAIRAREKKALTGRIPIIAMTTHAITGYRKQCLDAEMDGYLSKPVKAAELSEAIEKVTTAKIRQAFSQSQPAGAPADA